MRDWAARVRERMATEGLVPSAHAEAIQEIADHLGDLYRAALAAGLNDQDAEASVESELLRMGPLATAVAARDARRKPAPANDGRWIAGLGTDFRHAMRALRIERGFSAIVILTLAIGIGACTAVFSIVNALLLKSLPYPEPERLVVVWETERDNRAENFIVAKPVYEDWRTETRSFSALAVWEFRTFNVASDQEPQQVQGLRASSSLFTVLGVPPAMGRVFTPAEDEPGHNVVVISDAVWRTQFGGDRSAVGKQLRLNGEPYEVIGVMPPGFEFPRKDTGVWVPIAFTKQDQQRGSHSFWVAGRLSSNVSFETARADVEQVGRALQQRYEVNRNEGSTMTRMSEQGMGPLRNTLRALMGAVALVLVIGCVNVANLQFGRALKRRREFVLRLSLGAGLRRLARQLFVESVVLSLAGCAGGLLIAWMATRTADLFLAPNFRTLLFRGEVPITIDGTVLLFAAVIALLAATLFGFAPLVGIRRREPNTMLREGERGSTGLANAARRVMVAVEVGLAIIVLCGAGLLVKSLSALLQVNPGLDPRDVLTMYVSLPQPDTYGPPLRETFCADLSRNAEGLPGIRKIGAISHLPLSGQNAGRGLTIEGRPDSSPQDAASAAYRLTCPGYFATLGITFVEGRDFSERDMTRGERAAIVNRQLARHYWPGESALGKRLKLGSLQNTNPWITVVGVTENVRHFGLESDPERELFLPYSQAAWPVMTIVAKTVGEPLSWQSTLEDVVERTEPDLPVASVRAMTDVISTSVAWRETPMHLLTGFALIGLVLASIGVYGVLAYYVSQRTREIGVRAALGATRSQLAGLVVRQSLASIAAGVVLGVAGSLATGRLLTDLLYRVEPGDPQVLIGIVGLLVAAALLASWLPARRAASIDPLVALRDE
jgi:putative ABC transport system permease protein